MSIKHTVILYRPEFAHLEGKGYLGDYHCEETNSWIPYQGPHGPTHHNCGAWLNSEVEDIHFYKQEHTTHVGLVVKIHTTCERIMSDVWENQTWATVFNPTTCGFETIFLHGEDCWRRTEHKTATVDANEEIQEYYQVWLLGRAFGVADRHYEAKEYSAYEARITPSNGKWVEVIKGRKVKLGTKGLVFWTGIDNYNTKKLGVALTSRKDPKGRHLDVVWVAANNCRVISQQSF